MRFVHCNLVLACVLAGLSGCQLFNKKSSEPETPFLGAKNNEPAKTFKSTDPLIGGATTAGDLEGLLAGRVIDGAGNPADALIRWVCLDDGKGEDAPLEVAVNSQGYFMIQGLKSGKHYKLITNAKSGDKTLEVVTLARAPNARLLIHVNEKFAAPASQPKSKSDKGKKQGKSGNEVPASVQIPIPIPGWSQPDELPSPTGSFGDKTRLADVAIIKPPLANVPILAPVPVVSIAPGTMLPPTIAPGAAPVPSSVRFGNRLHDFALQDLRFQPWELSKQRRGQLVLLDFWKTNCPPCLSTIPTLRDLQNKYGTQGLQVVGIAYEDGGTLTKEQAAYIGNVAGRRNANYQLLLGGGAQCPLKRDMQVRAYPTMVLIDDGGNTLWRHEGGLDRAGLSELDFVIRQVLNSARY